MEQKKFMDIQRIRFGDELTEDNIGAFRDGDKIQISEKIDGSNASFRYDKETGTLIAFSRKQPLDADNTLNGFYDYVQSLDASEYSDSPDWVIFGEWLTKHTIPYRKECYGKWYVYDIYDTLAEAYLPQQQVKEFCDKHTLIYIHILYEGEFLSWEHCKTFCGKSAYTETGENGEGIVVKNQTNMNTCHSSIPFVLKIINEKFAEIQKDKHIRKVEDPQKLQEKTHAQEIVDKIITKNRIVKELHKMIDEQILPQKLNPQDMSIIAKNLPRRIYEDCVKEEKEYVEEAGEFFGKLCGNQCIKFAKELVLGCFVEKY